MREVTRAPVVVRAALPSDAVGCADVHHTSWVETHSGLLPATQVLLDTVVTPRTPAQLWVAESNPRARRFYEKNGFLPDGARFVVERLDLAELRLVR